MTQTISYIWVTQIKLTTLTFDFYYEAAYNKKIVSEVIKRTLDKMFIIVGQLIAVWPFWLRGLAIFMISRHILILQIEI